MSIEKALYLLRHKAFVMVAQKCPYTNFSLGTIFYPIHQRSVQGNTHRVLPAREAKDDFHIVIVHIDGHQESVKQFRLVLLVRHIPVPEHLKPSDNIIPGYGDDVRAAGGDLAGEPGLLCLQLQEPSLGAVGDDPLLNGCHDVLDGSLRFGQLVLQDGNVGLFLLTAAVGHSAVRDPRNHIILERIFFDGPGHSLLYGVPPHVGLAASLFHPLLLAGVVVMQIPGFAGAGDPNHGALALPAEQFPRQQIVAIHSMAPLWILFRFQHLLDFEEQLVADDPGNAALNADVIVDVDSPIPLVDQHGVEAALSPAIPPNRPDAPDIEIVGNVNERFPAGHAAKNLTDNIILGRIQLVPQILPLFIAKRQAAIGELTVLRVIPQTAPNILGHVLAVKLIDVHHGAEGEPARSRIVKIFLRVENADAQLLEPRFVYHGLEHIPAHAV